ncbi:hypothetical protein TVAG_102360 [Trichomonas vaginalis G3]|uniref:Homeobox domain-containing protein n=1 Tax=Trichomonas vaginalis (strain ATCC PRA-98 / G3) TaxID=412133 RepID=A2ECU2_TRIV3|nr:homeobox protein transcription factors family [Trichomonas vaginalis G3]EAY09487.1 hypothetical protein TVAG_102360 [Trichomonas vaginalis G3]KAI5521418.1 homeobox protein transcription factors family [Trichomonas vaginalis G3]|eukprot:XP_001321710.1 hypothetical protein [Trichomonas vaginalis G3]
MEDFLSLVNGIPIPKDCDMEQVMSSCLESTDDQLNLFFNHDPNSMSSIPSPQGNINIINNSDHDINSYVDNVQSDNYTISSQNATELGENVMRNQEFLQSGYVIGFPKTVYSDDDKACSQNVTQSDDETIVIQEFINLDDYNHPNSPQTSPHDSDDELPSFSHRKVRRGKNLPPDAKAYLNSWLLQHRYNPYPSKKEKELIMDRFGITKKQLATFLVNARMRFLQRFGYEGKKHKKSTSSSQELTPLNISFD